MKPKIKLGLLLIILCLALPVAAACAGGGTEGMSQQLVKVERGDIKISVTGSGKIEATREARLTFGSAGKVDKILVKSGDKVKAGDILASLDTSALELALAQSRVALTQAEVALAQAKLAKQTAEYNLKNTRDTEDALKLALLNAQIGLEQAQRNLDTGIAAADYDAARAELNRAKAWYQYVVEELTRDSAGSVSDWHLAMERAEEQLKAAQTQYDNILSGYDSGEIAIKRKQVEAAGLTVDQAQKNLDELTEDITIQGLQVESASQSVEQAKQSVELARRSLDEAQKQLDEATIVTPFDGVVAVVSAKEGDNIPSPSMAPTTIVHLVDPDYMELVVEVDEIDIPLLELHQEAVISVDALPGSEFEGTVTAIYPVPEEVGGVVLYDVRLSLKIPENSRIKIGMSASANVMIEKHSNVLTVPSRAIKENEQGQKIVKVMSDEQVQERQVVVGLDDGLRIEILSGLSEGETVVVEVKAKSTSGLSMF
jgi:HlyD family secretion protein